MAKKQKNGLNMPEYTADDYKKAITDLDEPPSDDFFGNKTYTETASSVMAIIKAIIYIVFIVAVSFFLAYFAIVFVNDVFAFVKEDRQIEVTIPEYVTADELGDILGDAGVVKYPSVFKIYAGLKKVDEKEVKYNFVPGTYTVNSKMNYDELLLSFVKKTVISTFRITIPEGYTCDQLIALFMEKGIGTVESWTDTINNYDFGEDFPFINDIDMENGRYYRLEGYLFPDTYEFYSGQEESYYLRKLLVRFNEMITDKLRAKMKGYGITLDQALTIASIIEKEAYYPSNYSAVSAVIWNRLNDPENFPRLECDSTIVYTLSHKAGSRVTDLTEDDLKIDDPFNSYVKDGLCPGPICNPGYQAICDALYPDESDYYFFVTDADNMVLLAKTRAEHQENVKKIREEKKKIQH